MSCKVTVSLINLISLATRKKAGSKNFYIYIYIYINWTIRRCAEKKLTGKDVILKPRLVTELATFCLKEV